MCKRYGRAEKTKMKNFSFGPAGRGGYDVLSSRYGYWLHSTPAFKCCWLAGLAWNDSSIPKISYGSVGTSLKVRADGYHG